jgi:hypothetical protein
VESLDEGVVELRHGEQVEGLPEKRDSAGIAFLVEGKIR